MRHYENVNNAPEYLQAFFKLIGFDFGEFSCIREANLAELYQLQALIQIEIAKKIQQGDY